MGAARLRDMVDTHRRMMERLNQPRMQYEIPADAILTEAGPGYSTYRLSDGSYLSASSVSSSSNRGFSWSANLNPSIAAYEFLEFRYGRGCAGPDRSIDGFIAEPVMMSDLYASQYGSAMNSPTWMNPTTPQPALARADEQFAGGDSERAVALYEEHLAENPDDFGVRVRFGLAMLESGRADDAVAVLHHAYASDPSLAEVSLGGVLDGWSGSRLRAMVAKSVSHANRTQSASAWMVVALLMEAEGRAPLAERMLDRAIGAGLDRSLAPRIAALIAPAK